MNRYKTMTRLQLETELQAITAELASRPALMGMEVIEDKRLPPNVVEFWHAGKIYRFTVTTTSGTTGTIE